MDSEQDHKRHGGARTGAGRKFLKNKRVKRSFTLLPQTSQALDAAVDVSERSYFVDDSIIEFLKKKAQNNLKKS